MTLSAVRQLVKLLIGLIRPDLIALALECSRRKGFRALISSLQRADSNPSSGTKDDSRSLASYSPGWLCLVTS